MRYFWLALTFSLVAVIGIFVGRALGVSPAATTTLAGVLAFLALFPFRKRQTPKITFTQWVIPIVIGAAVAWLLYLGFSRFGG